MNKVVLISEGHGKKYIHRNEIMFRCLILINIVHCRSVLEIAYKCRENWKDERKKLYVKYSMYFLTVYIRSNIRRSKSMGRYGHYGNKGHFLFVWYYEADQGN